MSTNVINPEGIGRFNVLLALIGSVFLYGCATIKPTPEQRVYYDQNVEMLRGENVGLIFDSCVVRDEVGQDYVLRMATEEISDAMHSSVNYYLQSSGYKIAASRAPFICGSVTPDEGSDTATLKMADYVDEDPIETAFPIPQLEELEEQPELGGAYRDIIRYVTEAEPSTSKDSPSREGRAAELELDPENVRLLREAVGTDFVWVVRAGGVQVSAGKSFGTGLLTGLLSAGLSGGALIMTQSSVAGNGYDVALVDLAENSLIWKKAKASRGDPTDPALYNYNWARALFVPFLSQ